MKKFFVQTKYPDGEIGLSVNTEAQILEMMGFRDCTDCEYEVFSADEFGKVVRLEYIPRTDAPFNLHIFVDSTTGEYVIEGYSTEH